MTSSVRCNSRTIRMGISDLQFYVRGQAAGGYIASLVRARPGVDERLHSSVTIRCGRSPFFTVRGSGRPSLTLSMPQSNPHSSHLSFTLGFGINRETEPKKPISLRGSEAKDNAFCFPSPDLSCNLPVRRTRPRPRDPCHPHSDARFV